MPSESAATSSASRGRGGPALPAAATERDVSGAAASAGGGSQVGARGRPVLEAGEVDAVEHCVLGFVDVVIATGITAGDGGAGEHGQPQVEQAEQRDRESSRTGGGAGADQRGRRRRLDGADPT